MVKVRARGASSITWSIHQYCPGGYGQRQAGYLYDLSERIPLSRDAGSSDCACCRKLYVSHRSAHPTTLLSRPDKGINLFHIQYTLPYSVSPH